MRTLFIVIALFVYTQTANAFEGVFIMQVEKVNAPNAEGIKEYDLLGSDCTGQWHTYKVSSKTTYPEAEWVMVYIEFCHIDKDGCLTINDARILKTYIGEIK